MPAPTSVSMAEPQMSPDSGIERREHRRVPLHAPLEYWVGDERGYGQVVDISMGGIRFDTAFPLIKEGESAKVVFVLGNESIGLEIICRFAAVGFGVGAEFINLTPEQSERLRALIGEESGS